MHISRITTRFRFLRHIVLAAVSAAVVLAVTAPTAQAEPAFLTGCDAGFTEVYCASMIQRWPAGRSIGFCARHTGRPSAVTAARFESALRDAVTGWNAAGANIRAIDGGDCATFPVSADVERILVYFDDAARSQGGQVGRAILDSRRVGLDLNLTDAEIMLHSELATWSPSCMSMVVAHEVGHAFGLGHSGDRADIMSSNASAAQSSCQTTPTEAEHAALRKLYASAPPPSATPSAPTAGGRLLSAPVFGPGGLALSVFEGGTVAQLEAAASPAGARGVWVQDTLGNFHLLVIGGPSFVNTRFRTTFPSGFAGVTSITLTR